MRHGLPFMLLPALVIDSTRTRDQFFHVNSIGHGAQPASEPVGLGMLNTSGKLRFAFSQPELQINCIPLFQYALKNSIEPELATVSVG